MSSNRSQQLHRLCITGVVYLTAASGAQSQSGTGIQVVSSHQISTDAGTSPHVESFIAVNPRNPRNLIAAAMGFATGESVSFPYFSFDGGRTWTRGQVLPDTSITNGADPIVYFNEKGTAFFSTLPDVKGIPRTGIARSADGGRTWQMTAILPSADRQFMAFDSSRGPFGGRTYFTGTGAHQLRDGPRTVSPFLVRSDDDGRTFDQRSLIAFDRGGPQPDTPLRAVPLEMVLTPSGLLVMGLQGGDIATIERLRRDSLDGRAVGLIVSNDGGDSFGPARYAPNYRMDLHGSTRRRYRSTAASGNIRVAIDASLSKYRNTVYFAASDYDRDADRFVVRVWVTRDFGENWKSVVASDAPTGDVANAAIAVNRDGVVALIWNDRRDDPKGQCWRLYGAISIDGGESFRPSQRLSDSPSCTNVPANWSTFASSHNSDQSGEYLAHFQTGAVVPTRFPNGGDTQGLVADPTGVFHAAWINGQTGTLQLWHSSFQLEPELVADIRSKGTGTSTNPDKASAPPAGFEDVTADVRFRLTRTSLDFATRTYVVTAVLENRGGRTLRGPLHAVMRHFLDPDGGLDRAGSLENFRVANADSGGQGVGATWKFEVQGGVLAPGQRSQPRILRFTFDGGVPEIPDGGYLSPGFRILVRTGSNR